MRRDDERLRDMLDAITAIERYLRQGRSVFDGQELIQVWVAYHLQMIGEAATALSPELKASYPDVLWPQIIGLRNLLVHEYFRIDIQVLWDIASNDLPTLKTQIQTILPDLEPDR